MIANPPFFRKHSETGYSLIEILVASVIGLASLYLVARGLMNMFNDTTTMNVDLKAETDIYQLVEQMMRTGKSSDSCDKVLVASAQATVGRPESVSLNCNIKVFSDQPQKSYRFRKVLTENKIRYEAYNGTLNLADSYVSETGWDLLQTFGGESTYAITGFELCKFDEIIAGGTSCPIPNPSPTATPQIGRVLSGNDPAYQSRYFRFEIKATHPNQSRTYDIQSAFFVRNPPPVLDTSYLWGTK